MSSRVFGSGSLRLSGSEWGEGQWVIEGDSKRGADDFSPFTRGLRPVSCLGERVVGLTILLEGLTILLEGLTRVRAGDCATLRLRDNVGCCAVL